MAWSNVVGSIAAQVAAQVAQEQQFSSSSPSGSSGVTGGSVGAVAGAVIGEPIGGVVGAAPAGIIGAIPSVSGYVLDRELAALVPVVRSNAKKAVAKSLGEPNEDIVQEVTDRVMYTLGGKGLSQTAAVHSAVRNDVEGAIHLSIRILEDPLTAQNLSAIISSLTELSTKYWLIAKSRFADLIEYIQTHNARFAEEAQLVITRISYNSPFNMDLKVDMSAPSVAEALVTTIDGVTQRRERLEEAKLENQAKALEIKEATQKAEQENQMALLKQEEQRLELERHRLEILEKELELQKKSIEYALELAGKVIDTLHPSLDQATRAMAMQALLPDLIQLGNGRGLKLALPAQQIDEKRDESTKRERKKAK